MEKLCVLISKVSMFVSASCTGILAIVMMMQIFCRKVLNDSLTWSDEMGGYLLVWIALFGAVTALFEKKHLAIDSLIDRMPKKVENVMRIVIDVLIIIFLIIVFYFSIPLMTKLTGMTAISLPIPQTFIYSPLVITTLFSTVILINDMIKDMQNLKVKGGILQ